MWEPEIERMYLSCLSELKGVGRPVSAETPRGREIMMPLARVEIQGIKFMRHKRW